MKKIDMHCHVTNRQVEGVLAKECGTEAVTEKMKQLGIEKTVVLATYFPHKGTGISNFRLLNWIKDKPEFEMFGSLDLENYALQGLNELEELATTEKIKGIKIYTGYQDFDLHGENFGKVRTLAAKYKLPLMFHVGVCGGTSKTGKATNGKEVSAETLEFIADTHPAEVIISHLGYPFIEDTIEAIKKHDNMLTDMSGLFYSATEANWMPYAIENVRRVLEHCGPKKVLFGSDFPVHSHEHAIEIVEKAMKYFAREDVERVFYGNAYEVLYGRQTS